MGAIWAFGEPETSEFNPVLLLWWMHDRVHRERLPQQRTVVEFHFPRVRPAKYWLILSPEDVSLCLKHPGYEIDVLVTAELAALYQVWLGRIFFTDAIHQQQIELDATPALMRAFPEWFALSKAASIVRDVATA